MKPARCTQLDDPAGRCSLVAVLRTRQDASARKIAGYSYDEIAAQRDASDPTVNRQLVPARGAVPAPREGG